MKKCLFLCTFCFFLTKSHAQFGFTVAPTFSSSPEWQVVVENFVTNRHTDFLYYGNSGIVDYDVQTRYDNWRLRPALAAMRSSFQYTHYQFEVYSVGLQGNVNFAPLGAKTADGQPKRTTFYIQLSPAISYVREKYRLPVIEEGEFTEEYNRSNAGKVALNAGASIFLEIRLTEQLSVSPLAGLRYYPNLEWEGFSAALSEEQVPGTFDRTDWRQFIFGLRMGISFDQ